MRSVAILLYCEHGDWTGVHGPSSLQQSAGYSDDACADEPHPSPTLRTLHSSHFHVRTVYSLPFIASHCHSHPPSLAGSRDGIYVHSLCRAPLVKLLSVAGHCRLRCTDMNAQAEERFIRILAHVGNGSRQASNQVVATFTLARTHTPAGPELHQSPHSRNTRTELQAMHRQSAQRGYAFSFLATPASSLPCGRVRCTRGHNKSTPWHTSARPHALCISKK